MSTPVVHNRLNPKIVVILGPTASGKSDMAVKLARKFNGEVVSADSRQVYKGMDIGTGKIIKKEMEGIPHYMLDIASPKTRFDVARYQKMAHKKIGDILKRGKLPIVCGGTGLYIKAIVENPEYPDTPPDWKLRVALKEKTTVKLFLMLKKLDSARARTIDQKNKRRLIRAIEIAKHSGKVPLVKSTPKYDALLIGIKRSPDDLRKAIAKRLRARFKQGMIAEVTKLHQDGVSWKRLEELGLEYRYIAYYLQKKLNKEKMAQELETKINQYARRQMTWFRKTPNARWIDKARDGEKLSRDFLAAA